MIRFLLSVFTGLSAASAGAQEMGFAEWVEDFRPRLEASGASAATISSMLDGLEPDLTVIERDRDQPEFVRPLWQYLEIAAGEQRVANGVREIAARGELLSQVEARYGVDYEVVTAIWALESSYGVILGDRDVVRSLATLAWEGRRRSWAEAQLIAVGRMIDRGYASREDLFGSWAGAMGQTQFIPETYLARASDFDGDGRIDIWRNTGDALGSAANLLSEAGWVLDAPIAMEVVLPEDFDLTRWDPGQSRLTAEWSMRGIRPAGEEAFAVDQLMYASRLVLPAGRRGPAFLTFPNFRTIMRYNNSTAYAMGIWLLSERYGGDYVIQGSWPENDPPITRSQTQELQSALASLGYDPGVPDGIFGPNTRRALMSFQRDNGFPVDGYAGRVMYEQLRDFTSPGNAP